jgi:hypothetical protein
VSTAPDILATVYFYPSDEGGRQTPTPSDKLNCIFDLGGEYFDCRLLLNETGPLLPGQEALVPIKFFYPDLVKPKIKLGDNFHLRESGTIARGVVDKLLWDI